MSENYAVLTARVGGLAGAPSPHPPVTDSKVECPDRTFTSYRVKPSFPSVTYDLISTQLLCCLTPFQSNLAKIKGETVVFNMIKRYINGGLERWLSE